MLRPREIDQALATGRTRAKQRSLRTVNPQTPGLTSAPARNIAAPGRRHGGPSPNSGPTRATRSLQSGVGTGINPWWRYQEESVPGGGRVMVNVGTGNMLLQDDDMSVPHVGVALAFRRTYNSQSQHNVAGDDGAQPGLYGNGWTSTFDAHLSGSSTGTLSVWDIDGARYDYTGSDAGGWTSPPGQHATLVWDGGCGYLWTKKSGTTYYMWRVDNAPACPQLLPQYGGYAGRLYQIIGRNRNVNLTFSYGWDTVDTSATGKIYSIAVQAESGLTATMYFTDSAGHRLLYYILFPDQATYVNYEYDAAGNLTTIGRPPNNASGIRPQQRFGYTTLGGTQVMLWADSPRYEAACASSCGTDGGYLAFSYTGTSAPASALSTIGHIAVVNPGISDGSNSSVLQSGYPTTAYQFLTDYFTTGVATPTFRDTDGHMDNWVVDAAGRPTQSQACTASSNQGQTCTGLWLVSNESWDAANNLMSEVDPRGNETDYLHDPMGNTIVVGEPYTTTSQGAFKPVKIYDYDAFNNVVAYCAETENHAAGLDWVGAPTSQSDSLCATYGGSVPHWRATFSYPSTEPYGQLASMTTPLGYTRSFSYAPSQQAGNDHGLPTSASGSSFTQLDGSTMSPTQTFWYDANGNLRCYSKGRGTSVLSYDTLGRMTSVADPDDSSANASSICGKSTGQPGWNTQTTYTYYADGAKHTSQTPSERAFGVATSHSYDLDGNVVAETAHHGCVPNQSCPDGTTRKWYDGAERLVEVALPMDPRTYSDGSLTHYDGDSWLTRYWYDLSAGGSVSVTASAPFHAYGNLYKTLVARGTSWLDKSGSQFDALDREVAKYSWNITPPNPTAPDIAFSNTLETTQLSYDGGSATLGLLAQKTNPRGEAVTYAYDERGKVLTETYSGDAGRTANETYLYDANGRTASVTSSQFGAQLNTYDADGRLTRVTEPTGGGVTDPAQIGYSYYPDGKRSAVSVTSATFSQSNAIAYSYRVDGLLQTQSLNAFTSASWLKTYTDTGRVSSVGGIDSQQRTYDATGQLQRHTIRGANIDYTHDPEGSPLTQYVPTPTTTGGDQGQLLTNTYNVRGELADTMYTPNSAQSYPHHRSTSWGGCITRSTIPLDGSPLPDPPAMDSRSCATVFSGTMGSVDYNTSTFPSGSTSAFAFDTAGRMTRSVTRTSTFAAPDTTGTGNKQGGYSAGAAITTTVTADTLYDAENHTVSRHPVTARARTLPDQPSYTTTTTTDLGAWTLGWGPNGHPLVVNAANQPGVTQMTLHWDGDVILFITDGSGNVIDFKAGLDGEIAPRDPNQTALATYERDSAGVIIGSSVNGTTSLAPLDAWDGTGPNFGGLNYAQYVRPDGFEIAGIQINGVRAFDPGLGGWTTPDAFEGDIHDPASQQKYMWNRGNPVDYSDPSGYCVGPLIVICYELMAIGSAAVAEAGAPGASAALGFGARTVVIGKMADLTAPSAIGQTERTLIPMLDRGSAQANWKQNSGFLRAAMNVGKAIRDATVNKDGSLANNTGFLRAERALLASKGWTYDKATHLWEPPPPVALPGPAPIVPPH